MNDYEGDECSQHGPYAPVARCLGLSLPVVSSPPFSAELTAAPLYVPRFHSALLPTYIVV